MVIALLFKPMVILTRGHYVTRWRRRWALLAQIKLRSCKVYLCAKVESFILVSAVLRDKKIRKYGFLRISFATHQLIWKPY